jgi:hypothetical protein
MARKDGSTLRSGQAGLPGGPLFYYRPYWNEHNFLEDYPTREPFDAAILLARHLAPHPPGSRAHRRGQTGRALADALIASGGPFVVDPDTPVLAAVGPGTPMPTPRVGTMAHAQVATVPVTPLSLASAPTRLTFANAAVGAQAGAAAVAAPYFQFARVGDPWHHLNLDLIGDAAQAAQGRPLVAFVQVSLAALAGGELAAAAPTYSGLGLDRVFIRVAGFDPARAGSSTIRAYRLALDAFAAQGMPPVADCVGRFGLAVTAAGAEGFSSGAIRHQYIAPEAVYHADEMISDPCRYEVPHRWYALAHGQARRDANAGVIPACPIPHCGALATGSGSSDLKEHLIHYFTDEVRAVAAAGTAATRQSLQQNPSGAYTTAWLSAV